MYIEWIPSVRTDSLSHAFLSLPGGLASVGKLPFTHILSCLFICKGYLKWSVLAESATVLHFNVSKARIVVQPSHHQRSWNLQTYSEVQKRGQLFYLTSFPLTCLTIPINKLSNSGAMPSHYLCQELTPLSHLPSYPTSISSPYLINQQPKHLATFTGNSLLPSLIPTARCPAMFLL